MSPGKPGGEEEAYMSFTYQKPSTRTRRAVAFNSTVGSRSVEGLGRQAHPVCD